MIQPHETTTLTLTTVRATCALFCLLPRIFWDACGVMAHFDVATPFVVGDFVYATDRAIVVRKPASPRVVQAFAALSTSSTTGKPMRRPEKAMFETFRPRAAFAVDPVRLPALTDFAECDECRGSGFVYSDDDGLYPCECCRGFGIGRGRRGGFAVGDGARLADSMILLMLRHGARVFPPLRSSGLVQFRFEIRDMDGMVMPLKDSVAEADSEPPKRANNDA